MAQIRDAQEGAGPGRQAALVGTLFDGFMNNPVCPLAGSTILVSDNPLKYSKIGLFDNSCPLPTISKKSINIIFLR
jgi:hypothetical protein